MNTSAWRLLSRLRKAFVYRLSKWFEVPVDHPPIAWEVSKSHQLRRVLDTFQATTVSELSPLDGFTLLNDNPRSRIEECVAYWNAHPISLAFPRSVTHISLHKSRVLSEIVPGTPYRFEREDEYYHQYEDSLYAVTHRKNGWDCFRHLEILGSGCVPLMLDIGELKWHAMTHYPVRNLKSVMDHARHGPFSPPAELVEFLRDHFNTYLTARAMANYLLTTVGALRNPEFSS